MRLKQISNSPFVNVFLFSFFWALQIFIAKLGFINGAKPVTMVFQAGIVALFSLAIYVLPKNIKKLKGLTKDIFWGLILANAIHFGLGGYFSNFGNALTSAINAGFLVKFALVTTTILAWIFLKEKMTWVKAISVLAMLFGNYLISTKGQSLVPQAGDILIILACLCWSVGNILIKKTLKNNDVNADIISFLRPVAGLPVFLFFLALAPMYPSAVQKVFMVNPFDTKYLIYAIGSGVFTALLWIYLNRTLKIASASYMTMMSMMTSVFVAILALTFLGETMTTAQLGGAVLTILAGVVTHYAGIAKG